MTNCSRSLRVACALVAFLSATAAAAERPNQPSVRVRVYDYASVPIDVLARAQDEVWHLYARIGVDTTWLETRRLSRRPEDSSLKEHDHASDLIVIVLNASMTTRMAPPEDVLGMAATTPTAHGHIAYVFYDRLRNDPQSHASSVSTLAFVMAHEIGHLMLPYGSHSDAGVMRGRWNRDGFSRLDVPGLQFTPLQGRQIRHQLEIAW
jgi:hypothetical protein